MVNAGHYFETARERYRIKLKREEGKYKPWTSDPIFKMWSFTNVHREDDRTTRWFAENIRCPLSKTGDKVKIAIGTTIFRWFNRIETGEEIKDLLLGEWNTEEARKRLKNVKPVVTGAYIIKGPDGFDKLDGVLHCVDLAIPALQQDAPTWGRSLKRAWRDLNTVYYLGRFMSYEIVTDLRWTPVLNEAEDIMTWANSGPGCARGLGWVMGSNPLLYDAGSERDQETMLAVMRELLEMSKSEEHWPAEWKPWEMHEVEMWACEYSKYRNAQSGMKLKRRYPGS